MKILFIGQSKVENSASNGPAEVFTCLTSTFKNKQHLISIFPSKRRNVFVNYLILFFILLKKWDIINVHLHATYGLLVGIVRFRSSKCVLTVHGYNGIEEIPQIWYSKYIQKFQIKFLFKNKIFVSNRQKRIINEKLNITGGEVIYNGIRKELLNDFKYSEKQFDIVSVCGYSKTKGIHFLSDTLKKFDIVPETCIIGPYRDKFEVKNLSEEIKKRVKFYGTFNHDEVIKHIKFSKIYINPSLYESFGISTLEALALGIPVIVTKGAGIHEILKHGQDCFIVDYGDYSSLKKYVEILLNDEETYNYISENSLVTASNYDWGRVAERYVNYFSKFLNN